MQGRYRDAWSFFYPDVDGIFFVVDTADRQRLSVVQEVLQEVVTHPLLRDREIPFIVLANKQDRADRLDEDDLKKVIQVEKLITSTKMQIFCKNTIGASGSGVGECFQTFEGRN